MINFHSEDIPFKLKQKTKLKSWILSTVKAKKKKCGDISYVFCSDEFLLKMNKEYLKHDTYTDIITFDYTEAGVVSGDIFISVERVRENAAKFSKTVDDELHRVIIHGILHLLGYKDKSKDAKEEMRKQEDLCLKALKNA